MGNKYNVLFHNIKFKMPESQLLIGLETSIRNWQKAILKLRMSTLLYIKSVHLVLLHSRFVRL